MGSPTGPHRGIQLTASCQLCGEPIRSVEGEPLQADLTALLPRRGTAPLELRLLNDPLLALSQRFRNALWAVVLPDGVRVPSAVVVEDPNTGRAQRYVVVGRCCKSKIISAETRARTAALAG